MAKITLTLCDVKPCNLIADREFELNGKVIHVCGEGCFVKYWSREYQQWKVNPYDLQANYQSGTGEQPEEHQALRLFRN